MKTAAVQTAKLDARKLRADFPIFERPMNGKPLAYLDSAATTQKPRQVIDALQEFYAHAYASVHRGVYQLAVDATDAYEGAREKVRNLLNAASSDEIVFTRGATEAINLVAYAYGLDNLGPGDVVIATDLEHHSNYVPWQYIAQRTGADFRVVPLDEHGELRLDELERIAAHGRVKVLAVTLVSNTLGTVTPIEELTRWAHARDAVIVVDAAQAAPHRVIDVRALGCDFLALSAHKLCGPSGIGALYGRRALLERMSPFQLGGHMIRKVTAEETTWGDLPAKFEAGTPAIAETIGFGHALDYVTAVGLDAIEEHERGLTEYAVGRLGEIPGIRLYGPPVERRAGIVSFNLGEIHPHDVAQVLDWEGIAIRAGHHCTQPLHRHLGVGATNRASFYLYSLEEEIDRLVAALDLARRKLG